MISQDKQSIFDISAQKYGTLDNIVKLSNDNSLSISENLFPGTDLTIDNEGLGEKDIKKEISDKGYTFNNNAQLIILDWILAEGIWNDLGAWIDTELWKDS